MRTLEVSLRLRVEDLHERLANNFGSAECSVVISCSRYYADVCGSWKYLVLIELDLAMVVNDEYVIPLTRMTG